MPKGKKSKAKAPVVVVEKIASPPPQMPKAKKKKRKIVAPSDLAAGFTKGHGGYLGQAIGGKLGGWLGDKAGDIIGSMFGFGAYEGKEQIVGQPTQANSLLHGTQAPAIENKGQAHIIRHREYVTDVLSAANFTNTEFSINPGNTKLFPWLSAIAAAYEEYQIVGMIMEYKPLISLTSTNANGAVVMATEYNVTKPAFTSKIAMENYEYAVSCAPYQCMFHAIECAPGQTALGSTHRYVQIGSAAPDQDERLYNLGNFQLAVQGQSSSQVIGELWVTFEVAFFKPLFAVGQGLNILTDKYKAVCPTSVQNPFNNCVYTQLPGSLLGSTISTAGIITFPVSVSIGTYLIMVSMNPQAGYSGNNYIKSNATASNCTTLTVWYGDSLGQIGTAAIGTFSDQLPMMYAAMISINAPGALQATFGLPSLQDANTDQFTADIVITQINGSILT